MSGHRAAATTRFGPLHLILVVGAGCTGSADGVPAWCASPFDDATVRFSAADDRPLALRERWRRGGLREGEKIARPYERPAIDRAGRVALIDFGQGAVVAMGTEGTWLGPVVRQGEGPGEVELPAVVRWADDGALLVADAGRREISARTLPSGEILREHPIPTHAFARVSRVGEIHWGAFTLTPSGDLLLGTRSRAGTSADAPVRAQLFRYRAAVPDADPELLLQMESRPLTERRTLIAPGFPTPSWAVGPGGVVAIGGDTGHYRIRILSMAGDDSVVVCRDEPGYSLTAGERGDTSFGEDLEEPVRREFEELRGWLAGADRPSSPNPVARLFFGSTGRLWVQRDRMNPFRLGPPPGATYDVFSPEGVYEGTVETPDGVILYGESDEGIVGYEIGPYDETSVVSFALVPEDSG